MHGTGSLTKMPRRWETGTGFESLGAGATIWSYRCPGILPSAPVLADIRSRGFKVEIDDFGTGESSLGMLADIQADILKLDRSFLKSGLLYTNRVEVIKAVVQLARSLKMGVIAEGVETEQQRDALVELGCYEAQGYLFYRPAPWQDFVGLG